MKRLLNSSKFLLLILDTILSTIVFFVAKYAQVAQEDIMFLVGILQPVFVALIVGIAVEDAAEKINGNNTRR